MDRGPARPLKGVGRAFVFWVNSSHGDGLPVLSGPSGAAEAGLRISRPADYPPASALWPSLLSVTPFKNRRFLLSAALRREDLFGMVPPI